jgi:hypothetical protein
VQGHPLSIRLLAGRFDELPPSTDLAGFLQTIEEELKFAEQATPASLEDPARQKTLYACLDYSVKRLTPEQLQVLRACGLFLAPFLSQFVEVLLEDNEQIQGILQHLIRLGLMERKIRTFADGSLELLELHPMLRWYLQFRFPNPQPEWQERYGHIYE